MTRNAPTSAKDCSISTMPPTATLGSTLIDVSTAHVNDRRAQLVKPSPPETP